MKSNHTAQTFSFKAPGAHSVLLAGDFTGWMNRPIPLRKQPDGVWKANVSLAPGTHYYRFVVDGEWTDDPECKMHVPNPFGTRDAVIEVDALENKNKVVKALSRCTRA